MADVHHPTHPTPVTRYNSENNQYHVGLVIKKVGTDQATPLDGAVFQITSLDGEHVLPTTNRNETIGSYSLSAENEQSSDLVQFLPKNIQKKISTIKTYDDVMAFATGTSGEDFRVLQNNDYTNVSWSDGYGVGLTMAVPLLLKELRSPAGYQKVKTIIGADAVVYFNFKNGSNTVDNVRVMLDFAPITMKYDEKTDYENIVTSSSAIAPLAERDILPFHEGDENGDGYYTMVIDEEGDVVLEAVGSIEGKQKVRTTKKAKLSAKTSVINSGNASSGNNIITTSVPKGLSVESGSISDGGVYNEAEGTIVWALPYLDPESETELSYNIVVGESANGKYTLGSSARSDQYSGATKVSDLTLLVDVDDTLVEEGVTNNPATGDIFTIIATAVIACMFVGACLFRKLKHVR